MKLERFIRQYADIPKELDQKTIQVKIHEKQKATLLPRISCAYAPTPKGHRQQGILHIVWR